MVVAGLVGAAMLGAAARLVREGRLPGWIFGLAAGGAVSNNLDRLALGAARDVIPTPWLVLDVADLAILVAAASVMVLARSLTRREVIPCASCEPSGST